MSFYASCVVRCDYVLHCANIMIFALALFLGPILSEVAFVKKSARICYPCAVRRACAFEASITVHICLYSLFCRTFVIMSAKQPRETSTRYGLTGYSDYVVCMHIFIHPTFPFRVHRFHDRYKCYRIRYQLSNIG